MLPMTPLQRGWCLRVATPTYPLAASLPKLKHKKKPMSCINDDSNVEDATQQKLLAYSTFQQGQMRFWLELVQSAAWQNDVSPGVLLFQ